MTEPELKPLDCPCCGVQSGIIYDYKVFSRIGYIIVCQNQDCLIQTPKFENMNQAIEVWNKRV